MTTMPLCVHLCTPPLALRAECHLHTVGGIASDIAINVSAAAIPYIGVLPMDRHKPDPAYDEESA